eukprot:g8610.t1
MYEKLPFVFDNGDVFTSQQKMFAKDENKKLIKRFRVSVAFGVITCFLLNILWCLFVLQIVPQTNKNIPLVKDGTNNNNNHQKYNYTLETCYRNGEISTIPVVHIIETYFPAYTWTIFFIDGFVIISITVSFLTLGKGFKHVLDGISFKLVADQDGIQSETNRTTSSQNNNNMMNIQCLSRFVNTKIILYTLGFGLILIMALLNPQGFLTMLSVFGSFALNLECGVFISLMANEVRSKSEFSNVYIPLKLSNRLSTILIKFAKYTFLFALVYDWVTCGLRFGIDPQIWYIIASIIFSIFLFVLYRNGIFKQMFCDNDENYEVLNDENDNGENDKAEVPALNNNSTIRSNNKNAQVNAYNPPSVKGRNDHDPFPLSRHNL